MGLADLARLFEGRVGVRTVFGANGNRRCCHIDGRYRSDPGAHGAAQRGARRPPSAPAAASGAAVRCVRVRARPLGPGRLRRLISGPGLRQATDTMFRVGNGPPARRDAVPSRVLPPRSARVGPSTWAIGL